MVKKIALVTGITGQDGSYLAELLLEKGYEVHGLIRRSSSFNTGRIDHLHTVEEGKFTKIFTHYGDLTDGTSLVNLINKIEPDEIYNLAAQSHVKISFELPEYTGDSSGLGTVRILEAIRNFSKKKIKFYQASTSELFGKVVETPQNEKTPFYPRSPYGVAKLYSFWITKNYREGYGIFGVNGILFNHESPRRGRNFVTRKITRNLCEIKLGLRSNFQMGNLDAKRDWGHAKDYVECMWLMMQQDEPEDFVIATGETHSVREFVELSCKELEIDLRWEGKGVNEVGIDNKTGNVILSINPKYFRPTEVDLLLGDPSNAKQKLGWEPRYRFKDIVKTMIKSDLEMIKNHDERF